jgi:hypothetical protein
MTTAQITKKSGKGTHSGVVSEVSAFLTVKPGHVDELRAAAGRFNARLAGADHPTLQRIGLRTNRLVIFDDGRRLAWSTSFDTDWDPYVDDAVDIIGVPAWVDWLQHTEEWREEFGESHSGIKAFVQSAQLKAASFFDALGDRTMTEIRQADRVQQAFQEVLDDPAAEQALTQPVLKPLLDHAAD